MNIRRKQTPKTLAWKPYIKEAVDFVNKKRVRHGRAMGLAPDKAEASFETAKEVMEPTDKAVSAFVLQDRAAEDREHNREIQNKARDKLANAENLKFRHAFHLRQVPSRSTANAPLSGSTPSMKLIHFAVGRC